jgi:coenzyme F420-reducing hydrogenase delta subunit
MNNKRKHKREKREYKQKRELRRFDIVLKEIFSRAVGKIISIATGEKIKEKFEDINQELKLLKSLRPDMLFKAGEKIFHIEIQAQQDKTLPKRMLIYSVGIEEKFGKEPVQIVLFVGKGNPPPSYFKSEFKFLKFIVVDWKKIDPDEFLRSDKPEEVVLGILAGKYKEKPEVFKKVIRKISKIVKNKKELLKYMEDISFLGGLFDFEIKAEPMPIQIDIRKTLFYKWGEKEGEKRGIVKGLEKGEKRGIIKGLKKAILLDVQLKFGSSKARQIKKLLDKINNINRLEKIKKEVIKSENWDDFVKFLKNSNSKNKNSR